MLLLARVHPKHRGGLHALRRYSAPQCLYVRVNLLILLYAKQMGSLGRRIGRYNKHKLAVLSRLTRQSLMRCVLSDKKPVGPDLHRV